MNDSQVGTAVAFVGMAAFSLYWYLKKDKAHSIAAERIANEGGEITEQGSIGMLVVAPFAHSTSDAAGHYFKVTYGTRSGTWFVRTSSKRPEGEWLWVDNDGEAVGGLPVPRKDDSRTASVVRRIPHWVAVALVIALILAGILAGVLCGKRG